MSWYEVINFEKSGSTLKNKDIVYSWGDGHLLIALGNRTQPRIKMLFLAEFIMTGAMATVFLLQSLPISHSLSHWVAGVGAFVIYILASYRFLTRMLIKESIMLDEHCITIINKTFFFKRVKQYEWRKIGALRYAGKEGKTDHPLKGRSFDYFGFETQEHLIQSLHHNGNLYFYYDDYRVYFARGVYSWHAEEMVHMMRLFAGNSLRLGSEWAQILQTQEFDDAQ